jgi:Predicted integral membrane protein
MAEKFSFRNNLNFIEVKMQQNIEFRKGVIRPVECYREAFELTKNQYWLLLAITLVGMIIGGATFYVLLGAMICGIYYCYFQAIDGRKVEFEGLFKGFGYFVPSLLVTALIVVPMIVVFAAVYFPFIMVAVMGSRLSEEEFMALLVGTLGVDLIITIAMVCLHTLLMFAFPLIVDKNLPAWQSIKLSARAVWGNLGGVGGLIGLSFVATLAGYLALCIGIYLVIPLILASTAVAYRKVFPQAESLGAPPSPDAFPGAGNYT